MRRKDREVTDRTALEALLGRCRVCRVAVVDRGAPYMVPVNYGWRWPEGKAPELYIHGAKEGRLRRALWADSRVCVELDAEGGPLPGETPCQWSFAYESLIGEGTARLLTEPEEKRAALDLIMKQLTGTTGHAYPEKLLEATAVFCLTLEQVSGKRHG